MTRSSFRKEVIVLDRDGTLVVDRGYNSDPAQLTFLPGVPESLRAISEAGYRIVVVTNQSGVGRGFFTLDDVEAANAKLLDMTAAVGSSIARIYYCPHHPDDGCPCRKPGTELMRLASLELGFDPRAALVVGDKPSDVLFGARAGAKTILIGSEASHQERCHSDRIVTGFSEVAELIIERTLWA
jgi:histidinol-phosphate phosphatase family protein